MLAVPQPASASEPAHIGSATSFPRVGRRMSGAQHTEQSPGPMPTLRHIAAAARPRRSWLRTAATGALAAAVALPAGGCADGSAPARARDGRVKVTLDDFSITPQRIRAKPGRITFEVANHGKVGHTLRVLRGEKELAGV